MKKLLTTGLVALGLATGASAQGISYSGGSVETDAVYWFGLSGGGGSLLFYGLDATVGADFTGSDWEFQIDGDMPAFSILPEYYEVSLLLAKQTSASSKLGAYVSSLSAGGDPIRDYGLVGMWQTSAGGYFDASVGALHSNGRMIYATARYSQNGWFGEGWMFSVSSTTYTGLSGGYEYTFANNATLDASITAWSTPSGPTVGVARLAFEIPFGGANTPGDIDSRLFRNYNFSSLNLVE